MIGWRIPLATISLLTGVGFATDPNPGWRAIGGVFLVFVPSLIADHVVNLLGGPRQWRRPDALNDRLRYRPEYPPVESFDDLLPGREPEMYSEKESRDNLNNG